MIIDYLLPGPRVYENRRAAWIELQGPPTLSADLHVPPWPQPWPPREGPCGFQWLVREFRRMPRELSLAGEIVECDVDLLEYIISFLF